MTILLCCNTELTPYLPPSRDIFLNPYWRVRHLNFGCRVLCTVSRKKLSIGVWPIKRELIAIIILLYYIPTYIIPTVLPNTNNIIYIIMFIYL
jgi:hypothetical protein